MEKKYTVYLDGRNRYVRGYDEGDALRAALAETPAGAEGATWRVNEPSYYGGVFYDVDRPYRVTCLALVKEEGIPSRRWSEVIDKIEAEATKKPLLQLASELCGSALVADGHVVEGQIPDNLRDAVIGLSERYDGVVSTDQNGNNFRIRSVPELLTLIRFGK